jgi:aspartate 1-decarboxylase
VIPGQRGGGQVELNGAMARIGTVGDRLIVMSFVQLEPDELSGHRPRVVALDKHNRIVERLDYPPLASGIDEPAGSRGVS